MFKGVFYLLMVLNFVYRKKKKEVKKRKRRFLLRLRSKILEKFFIFRLLEKLKFFSGKFLSELVKKESNSRRFGDGRLLFGLF